MMMRRDTEDTGRQAKNAGPRRQFRNLALGGLFLLAACGGSETSPENLTNPTGQAANRAPLNALLRGGSSFAAASSDESRATEVGRDILQNGGNATDAAIAMYFAMAVTLPSAAGLGASGACVVHNSKTRAGEAFVFAPVAAPGPVGGIAFTVPSGVRAMALMHIRHGQARWEMTVAPAERMARAGVPVSRALARDLQAGGAALGADAEARRVFGKGTGATVTEGDVWAPSDLGGTLAVIRQRGGVDFFSGNLARLLSDQVSRMGGSLPLESLRNTVPQAGPPQSRDWRGFKVYAAPAPMAGANALAGWNGDAASVTAVPTNSNGISGLAAVDSKGGAAACSLSMGQLFGARLMVPGTGILLGAPTPDASAVSPLVIANPFNGEFRFAGAGGGSPGAAFATGAIARTSLIDGQAVGSALAARGGQGGYVNAMACPDGIRGGGYRCNTGIDPAGSGLALVANVR
jgi:gamma-glutamyltranspeptidase/glutathione hydrolase